MRELGYSSVEIDEDAMSRMVEYSWPGNIRQLRNVLERAVIMAGDDTIREEHLAIEAGEIAPRSQTVDPFEQGLTLDDMEKVMIERALKKAGGVQKKAAQLLGISARVINYKIQKHNIET